MFGKIIIINLIYKLRKVILKYLQKLFFNRCHNPQKILIHRIGSFGDSIVALPAVWSIRQAYPDAIIHVASTHATPLNLSTVIDDGIIDEFILIKKKDRSYYLKTLQQRHYDLYIEIPQNYGLIKSIRNMIIVRYYLGIKSAFGWDAGWTKRFTAVQQKFSPPPREVDRFLRTLQAHGIPSKVDFPLKMAHTQKTTALLRSLEEAKTVAFVIGTNVPANQWPLASWCDLARRLGEKGYTIVVVAGEQERPWSEELCRAHPHVMSVAGEVTLDESATLLKRLKRAVCHDTGAMHLAYAVGASVVALFSPRQLSTKWYPYGSSCRVLEADVACRGCYKKICPHENLCMKLITVDEVEQAVYELEKDD